MGISEVVVLRQSSMQVGDSLSDKVNDIEDAFFPGPYGWPLFIGFTEMDRHMEVEAEKVGMSYGYRYFGSPSDGGFAVRVTGGCVIRRVGYVKTLDTNIGMKTGNYGEKGIFFVTVQTRLGN